MGLRITPQALVGLAIILFGVLLTGDNLDWFEADRVVVYWPLLLVAFGLLKVSQSEVTSGKVFGGVVTLVGVLLTVERVWDVDLDIGRWWPLVLVAVGSTIVWRAMSATPTPAVSSPGSDAEFSEFAVWSGKVRKNASPAFRRADLTAVMGGIEVDLRGAAVANGEAVIDVFTWWGGIEITVPPDWAVSNQVTAIMGGADDSSTGRQDAKHRLIVRGVCIMGGVEIKT
jgi:hypothetical protein